MTTSHRNLKAAANTAAEGREGVFSRLSTAAFRFLGAATNAEMFALTVLLAMAALNVGMFVVMLQKHLWILDTNGHPLVRDFVAFWTAGRQALSGHALDAYDSSLQHAAEVTVIGHSYRGTMGWLYPPLFLFVAAVLACFPYSVAFVGWCAATFTLQARVLVEIVRSRLAVSAAFAAPWVIVDVSMGQNGFLTASIIGLVLLQLERRPAFSGILLGLLSYKPHLGVLFPVALLAGGYWRAFGWAAFSCMAWNGLALAVFGIGTFNAFLHSLPNTAQTHLLDAGPGLMRFQSLYCLIRALGGSSLVAWAAQGAATLVVAFGVAVSWRARIPYPLKAAILVAGVPLVTPYVLVYDFPILSIAVAFLCRHRSMDRIELALVAASVAFTFAYFWVSLPVAYFASVAIAVIAARRGCLALLALPFYRTIAP